MTFELSTVTIAYWQEPATDGELNEMRGSAVALKECLQARLGHEKSPSQA